MASPSPKPEKKGGGQSGTGAPPVSTCSQWLKKGERLLRICWDPNSADPTLNNAARPAALPGLIPGPEVNVLPKS